MEESDDVPDLSDWNVLGEEEAGAWESGYTAPKKPTRKSRVIWSRMNPQRTKVPPPQMIPPQARRARKSSRPQRIPDDTAPHGYLRYLYQTDISLSDASVLFIDKQKL